MERNTMEVVLLQTIDQYLALNGRCYLHNTRKQRANNHTEKLGILKLEQTETTPFSLGDRAKVLVTASYTFHLYSGLQLGIKGLDNAVHTLATHLPSLVPVEVLVKEEKAEGAYLERGTQQYKAVLHFTVEYIEEQVGL